MTKTPHKWLIAFGGSALQELRRLPSSKRMAVFRICRQLLQAENPLVAHGVKKLKGFEGTYRTRAGDYRILFMLNSESLTHLNTEYKGTLMIDGIKHRSGAYRP